MLSRDEAEAIQEANRAWMASQGLSEPLAQQQKPSQCRHKIYRSEHEARLAHARAAFRVRPFVCHLCGRIRVANQDRRDHRVQR